MKLSVPGYALGAVLHELHAAEVDSALLLRTGPGWMIEFMTPIEPGTVAKTVRLGGVVMV